MHLVFILHEWFSIIPNDTYFCQKENVPWSDCVASLLLGPHLYYHPVVDGTTIHNNALGLLNVQGHQLLTRNLKEN
jgi:hypothetical protein